MFPFKFSRSQKESDTVYGAEFELVAPPTQPITGIVRDAETRQPLAGVSIESNMFAGSNFINTRQLRAVSDEQGRYRLVGMPKGAGNRILAVPNDDQPYLMRDMKVPESRGLEPVQVDFELHRGIWITGRVTDLRTGAPLVARLHYLPFQSNEYAQKTPEFGEPGTPDGFQQRYVSRPDGSYRLVGLAGRAIVGAECELGHYRKGVGADSIAGMNEHGHFETYFNPVEPGQKWPNAMKEINPTLGTETVVCDLALDPGEKLTVNVLDPTGKPLDGFEAQGSGQSWSDSRDVQGTFDVITLGPEETRTVVIRHKERKLGKVIRVTLADHPSGSFSVLLEPTGKIVGRLFDREGTPVSGAAIEACVLPMGDFSERLPGIATDAQGHFEYTDVPTGCRYDLNAEAAGMKLGGWFARDVAVEPGETKDLGDVVYGSALETPVKKPAESEPDKAKTTSGTQPTAPRDRSQANSATSGVHHLRGRVVDAKGQPVVDARVRVYRNYWLSAGGAVRAAPDPQWLADSRSDAAGRFLAEFDPLSAAAESQAKSRGYLESIGVFAMAEGFGFALKPIDPAASDELELPLVPDSSPIEGRVLDPEGRPVRGARVSVRALDTFDEDPQTLDHWLAEVRASAAANGEAHQLPGGRTVEFDSFLNPFPVAATDDEGRFTVRGIGADRVAYLEVEGPKIATTWLPVVTRLMEPLPLASRVLRFPAEVCYLRFSTQTCYGARCTVVTVPEQPIAGIVRDADTGQPLPDTEVRLDWSDNAFAERGLATKTDAEGRYRLSGLPKPPGEGQEVELRVLPAAGQPYFRTEVKVPRLRGLDAVTCNVPLRRGVTLRGRVTDRKTGQPVRAAVRYYPFLTNQAAAQYASFEPVAQKLGYDDRYETDDEGRFALPALPGRGVLTVVAERGDHYTLADGAEAIADLSLADQRKLNVYHLSGLNQDNAVRAVDIPEDASEFALDVQLAPLPLTSLLLVDRDGNKISGVETQGLIPMNPFSDQWSNSWREPLPTASAELFGPEAGEARDTLFLDRARNLGAMVRLTSADIDVPTKWIVLRPCGSVRGRIVDERGQAVAGAWINAEVLHDEGTLTQNGKPVASSARRYTWRLILNPVHADADGHFELKGVPPGARYAVMAYAEKRNERWRAITAEIKPGANVELGDVAPQTDEKQESAAHQKAAAIQAATQTIIRGQVLNPEGQPLAGANVLVRLAVFNADDPPLGSTVSDDVGCFELAFHWPDFDERTGNKPNLTVVANADGLAPDWKYLPKDEPPGDVTLNLLHEKAIEGRIVNEEGKPLAGVELRGEAIARYDAETMKMVLDDVAQGRNLLRMGKTCNYGALPNQPGRVTTAADGRFRIGGLSANTVVKLHLRGAGIRETRFNATTAVGETIRGPVPPVEPPYGPRAGMVLYVSPFDYVAEPGRRIEGTVRDHETGMPLARAKVMIYQPTAAVGGGYEVTAGVGNDCLSAETDEAGRYSIDGCAKNTRVGLNVDPPADGPAYFPAALPIEDAPGLAEVVQNVDLVPGIELRGRIVDSETAQPLIASLQYAPLYLNKYAAPLYEQGANLRSHTRSDADGSFRLAVAPGPGAVAVSMPTASSRDYMTIRVGYEDVVKLFEASPSHRELAHSPDLKEGLPNSLRTQGRGGWSLLSQTGEARVILVCPEEKKPPEPVEVRLVRGRRIHGKVVDPEGQPLARARAYLNNPGIGYQSLSTAEFTVTALAPGEKRDIAFQHDERRLGAFRTISADEAEPLIVPLEPYASARGRALDEQGAPVQGMHVWFYRVGDFTSEATFAVTDAAGRFRIDKLIPEQSYEVLRTGPGSMSHRQFSPQKLIFSVASGKTHELGDLIVKGPVETVSQEAQENKSGSTRDDQ